MKIIAINGSHRGENGYTEFLLNKLFQGAQEAGADCEIIHLAKMKMNRCTGCQHCHNEDSLFHCIYENKDDVLSIFNRMRDS